MNYKIIFQKYGFQLYTCNQPSSEYSGDGFNYITENPILLLLFVLLLEIKMYARTNLFSVEAC